MDGDDQKSVCKQARARDVYVEKYVSIVVKCLKNKNTKIQEAKHGLGTVKKAVPTQPQQQPTTTTTAETLITIIIINNSLDLNLIIFIIIKTHIIISARVTSIQKQLRRRGASAELDYRKHAIARPLNQKRSIIHCVSQSVVVGVVVSFFTLFNPYRLGHYTHIEDDSAGARSRNQKKTKTANQETPLRYTTQHS